MASRVAVLLLLGVICIGFAAGEIVVDCCLSTSNKHLPHSVLISYIIQEAGKGCDISATIFTTKKGRRLCVPPASQETWVQDRITFLDKKSK
ncbi:hypothetical protein PAMP_021824 [Pampus punctatissimus]